MDDPPAVPDAQTPPLHPWYRDPGAATIGACACAIVISALSSGVAPPTPSCSSGSVGMQGSAATSFALGVVALLVALVSVARRRGVSVVILPPVALGVGGVATIGGTATAYGGDVIGAGVFVGVAMIAGAAVLYLVTRRWRLDDQGATRMTNRRAAVLVGLGGLVAYLGVAAAAVTMINQGLCF